MINNPGTQQVYKFRFTLSFILAISCVPAFAESASTVDSDWKFAAGGGIATYPRYPGAKASRVLPAPILTATYKDFFFADTVRGIGLQDEVLKGLTLSAALGVSLDARSSKDNSHLDGLQNISAAPDILLGADYRFDRAFIDFSLSERIGRQDRRGGVAAVDVGYNFWTTSKITLGGGVTAQAMDRNYAKNFFGIDAAQSAASGLPVYAAKAGLKDAGLFVQGQYQIDRNWSLSSRIADVKLEGDAGRSPVVERRLQPSIFFAATRNF